jgi:hypothetical protein
MKNSVLIKNVILPRNLHVNEVPYTSKVTKQQSNPCTRVGTLWRGGDIFPKIIWEPDKGEWSKTSADILLRKQPLPPTPPVPIHTDLQKIHTDVHKGKRKGIRLVYVIKTYDGAEVQRHAFFSWH